MRKRDAYRARKSVLKNKTRPVRSEAGTSVGRIDALTRNARNTWFALLGLLVFVGITLMGVEHIDFYGIDRATKLPLVNVDVPTRYFFVTAPILTAAFYIYFHLHLIRLWDALGAADNRIGGQPLGDAVMPWLVTDAVLYLRNKWRADNCAAPRALDVPATFLNLVLTWGFGLIVLYSLWQMSLAARTFWITAVACSAFLAAGGAGVSSLKCLLEKMNPEENAQNRRMSAQAIIISIGVVLSAFFTSYLCTEGPMGLRTPRVRLLAPIYMPDLAIVEKPTGWLPRDIAKADFFSDWCKRGGTDCTRKELSEEQLTLFEREFRRRREAAIAELRKPQWHQPGHQKPDFRGAQLAGTFLAGVDLRLAHMEGVGLKGAQMEGADLSEAQMDWADLSGARMEGAHLRGVKMDWALLSGAQMRGADLSGAQMNDAYLGEAQMPGAILIGAHIENAYLGEAHMEKANLRGAKMKGADLHDAHMGGADLSIAHMEKANLRRAQMKGADLSEAQMDGADLSKAQMEGADLFEVQMKGAILFEAQMKGVFLIGAQMEGADLRGAQMEGVDLRWAQMAGVDLSGARMAGVDLRGVQMAGANLTMSFLESGQFEPSEFPSMNLQGVTNYGGALRSVDLRDATFDETTDFRNAFLDGTVQTSDSFREQMGNPCQWHADVLSDEEFFGRWLGWLEASENGSVGWQQFLPIAWRNVAAIAPPDGCVWQTESISNAPR
ncbi:Pentapeptide repeat-containing protein [Rhodovulum sulfidophilum]|uniref:Pentapeptide repeat-containing protein n=1 Tax=Rhodovulum sulfidophilum TaxID=35806 RepID=A0A0D6AZG8_RHOSU|nr:Pentapeptide repeat-containing protein [Rhodovulum sulfidophilum]